MDGEAIPEQPSLEELQDREGVEDGTWALVNLGLSTP